MDSACCLQKERPFSTRKPSSCMTDVVVDIFDQDIVVFRKRLDVSLHFQRRLSLPSRVRVSLRDEGTLTPCIDTYCEPRYHRTVD